jgi:hypothetical protein
VVKEVPFNRFNVGVDMARTGNPGEDSKMGVEIAL